MNAQQKARDKISVSEIFWFPFVADQLTNHFWAFGLFVAFLYWSAFIYICVSIKTSCL